MLKVNDQEIPWREGMTVTDLLDSLEDDHDYAVIRVNGTYVSKPHFDAVKIPDKAEIYLIPMVVGG